MVSKISKSLSTGASTSPAGKLDLTDFRKILVSAAVLAAGVFLTEWEKGLATEVDIGEWTAVMVAANSFLVNGLRKLLADNTETK
jgi:hypothetical protein